MDKIACAFKFSGVSYGKNEIHKGEYYVAEESHY